MNGRNLLIGSMAVALAGMLGGCGDSPTPEPTLEVDPSVVPPVESLPSLDGTEPRPIAAVEDEQGKLAQFVSNELWLSTHDLAELDALVERWNGRVIASFHPAEHGLEDTGLPVQYLVRIDTSLADVEELGAQLKGIDGGATGALRVSTQEGHQLLAAAAHEASMGAAAGVNWVGQGFGFRRQTTEEAPSGHRVTHPYTPNAFEWGSHAVGEPHDIGVAEAWRVLDLAGKLDNRVKIAILDGGFAPDDDFNPNYDAISNVPFKDAIGSENLMGCGGGECPWHGTNVASVAMAIPDNGYGNAGPAGPMAEPVFVFTAGDMFTSISAIGEARAYGAKIVNMSYGVPVPSALAFSNIPFDAATAGFHASGMLLFAAAGNDGDDVDGTFFGVETTWHTPCENNGVICVGGVDYDSMSRHEDSNYGKEHVDIFAPYLLRIGPDPDAASNIARRESGTSLSSPFVAGVAALIWAADPTLSHEEVLRTLHRNANPSPDKRVPAVVNALDAVLEVVGSLPPSILFDRLEDGDEIPLGIDFYFRATVEDLEDGIPCCDVEWRDETGSVVASGTGHIGFYKRFDTPGPHSLFVHATDSDGNRTFESITVEVVNQAPSVAISRPQAGETAYAGHEFMLRATGFDLNEPSQRLACDRLVWNSNVATDPFPQTGCRVPVTFETVGYRQITVMATDPQGATGLAIASLHVITPPPNLPPVVEVTSPGSFEPVSQSRPITLSGTAYDPEGSTALEYTWSVHWKGDSAVVGSGPTLEWTPSDTIDFDSMANGSQLIARIQLDVSDPQGNVASDYVFLEWSLIR